MGPGRKSRVSRLRGNRHGRGGSIVTTQDQNPSHEDPRRQAALAFGAALRAARVDRRISQVSLANLGNLDTSYLSLLERGLRVPSFLVIVRLAEALDVSPVKLFADGVARLRRKDRGLSVLYRLAYREMDDIIEVGPGYPDLTAVANRVVVENTARKAFNQDELTHIVEYIRTKVVELPQGNT